jgi:hypothetical protein
VVRGGNGTAVQCDTPGGYVVVLEFWKHAAPADRKSTASGEAGAGRRSDIDVPQRGCEVEEIVNIAAIAVVDAQETEVALDAELKADKTAKNAGHADAGGATVQHSESRAWKAQLGEATEGRGKRRSVAQLEGNVIE